MTPSELVGCNMPSGAGLIAACLAKNDGSLSDAIRAALEVNGPRYARLEVLQRMMAHRDLTVLLREIGDLADSPIEAMGVLIDALFPPETGS